MVDGVGWEGIAQLGSGAKRRTEVDDLIVVGRLMRAPPRADRAEQRALAGSAG